MRIEALDLIAFGPFTDRRLEFHQGAYGLHLVYGPNEAGKSSALRALRDALFGIPDRSTDNFLHRHPDLRIGMQFRTRDGAVRQFTRRKGRSNTLLDPTSETPLPDDFLAPVLGSIDRSLFESMFGIDYDRLVAGGKEITQLEGSVGQTLFSAASGLASLRDTQRELEQQAEQLFKSTGTRPRLNALLRDYREAVRETKNESKGSRALAQLEAAIEQAEKRVSQLSESHRRAERAAEQNQRILDAIGPLAKRREIRACLETLTGVPLLRDDFQRDYRTVIGQRAEAVLCKLQDEQQHTALQRQLNELTVPQQLLDQCAAIPSLTDQLGSHRKAQRDLPELRRAMQNCRSEARDLLADLQPEYADLDDAQLRTLRGTLGRRITLRRLGETLQDRQRRLQQTERSLQDRQQQRRDKEKGLAELPRHPHLEQWRQLSLELQTQAPMENSLAECRRELAKLEARVESALAQLHGWIGGSEELTRFCGPCEELIADYEARRKAIESHRTSLRAQLEELNSDLQREQATRHRIEKGGTSVVSEEALAEARRARDQYWQLLRSLLDDFARDTGQSNEMRSIDDASTASLRAEYEKRVADADTIADRLRRESDRVSEFARCEAEIVRLEKAIARSQSTLEDLRNEESQITRQWRDAWRPLQQVADHASEMRAWLRRQNDLIDLLRRRDDVRRQRDEYLAALDDTQRNFMRRCAADGIAVLLEHEPLQTRAIRTQQLIDRWQQDEVTRRGLERDLELLQDQIDADSREQERLRKELVEAGNSWRDALIPLGLPAESTSDQLDDALNRIDQAIAKIHQASGPNGLLDRIEGIQRESEAFDQGVRELAMRCGVQVDSSDAPENAERLLARLRDAKQKHDRQSEIRQLLRELSEKIRRSDEAIQIADKRLQALSEEARCEAGQSLDDRYRQSVELSSLREKLALVESGLERCAAGLEIDELEAQVQSCNELEVQRALDDADQQEQQASKELAEAREELGGLRQQRKEYDTGTQAINASARVQATLAEIERCAGEYVRTTLAAAMLRRAIDAFNERYQGPMLQRASGYFRQLTAQAFTGVRIGHDDNDRPTVVGSRQSSDGREQTVPAIAMSDGSADQLYFALRLAYLAEWLERNEALPLIIDDILIKFDDQRALATLQALAEFSHKTQVIVFTHHQHLLDLARSCIANETLFVQQL